jgi:putative tricarboxylic transport membrane protein
LIQPDALLAALSLVFTFKTLMWLTIGVILGVGVGAMPGLTATGGVALVLPLTFGMDAGATLGLLIGLYKGAVYGGSISAISFATPGTPEAAATVFDGYKLMRAGKGRKALLMALYASVTSDFLSDVLTIVIAPTLALVALSFGPSERFWLMTLAITLLAALSGRHLAKGLFSAAVGIYLGTIGSDPVSSVARNTFGIWWLQDGIHLVPLFIGVFAMANMLEESLKMLQASDKVRGLRHSVANLIGRSTEGLSFKEYLSTWKEIGIGLGVGSFVGMLPGLGATVGAFLSYSIAKQVSPHKNIGSGVIEGVAAAESGNNATVGPTLIPLLAFGIPGSSTAALIGGALMFLGATPGPRMFELYPTVVYALFIILLIGNVFNLGVGRVFAFVYAKLGELPRPLLVPLVILMSVIGAYAFEENPYDVIVMLVFGLIGFGMRIFAIPEGPMVITFLITPMAEEALRKALLINQGNWAEALFHGPLAIGLCVSVVVFTLLAVRIGLGEKMNVMSKQEGASMDAPDRTSD